MKINNVLFIKYTQIYNLKNVCDLITIENVENFSFHHMEIDPKLDNCFSRYMLEN